MNKEVVYYDKISNDSAPSSLSLDPSIDFLNKALERYGKHGALYISFGTLFFPQARHIEILIETLLALEPVMPFVFAIAGTMSPNPDAKLSDELVDKIKDSGRGIVAKWAPQQSILSHPVSFDDLVAIGLVV